jgi:K(+)-stimulated pyrophosphate-energized sodium pump
VLIAPVIISLTLSAEPNTALRMTIAGVAVLIILVSILVSKRKGVSIAA